MLHYYPELTKNDRLPAPRRISAARRTWLDEQKAYAAAQERLTSKEDRRPTLRELRAAKAGVYR